MGQPFRILDLPTELIRQICTDEGFDRHDFMALRLTCRLTCGFSTQPFDTMCFIGISVLLTRRSLQALIDISKHPRIGPELQVITITPLRTFLEALPSLLPTNDSVYCEGDLAKGKASAKLVHQYLDLYHEEMELEQTGDTVKLLVEAFMSIKNYGHPLCLEISDDETTNVGAQGCYTSALVEETEEDEDLNVFKAYWKKTMAFVIKAVTDSGCQVARLSLRNVT
jgi:hypothetical protein